jgi:hypothetical protein
MQDDALKKINQRLTKIEYAVGQLKAAVNEIYELTALDTICRDVVDSERVLSDVFDELLALSAKNDDPIGDA